MANPKKRLKLASICVKLVGAGVLPRLRSWLEFQYWSAKAALIIVSYETERPLAGHRERLPSTESLRLTCCLPSGINGRPEEGEGRKSFCAISRKRRLLPEDGSPKDISTGVKGGDMAWEARLACSIDTVVGTSPTPGWFIQRLPSLT